MGAVDFANNRFLLLLQRTCTDVTGNLMFCYIGSTKFLSFFGAKEPIEDKWTEGIVNTNAPAVKRLLVGMNGHKKAMKCNTPNR